MNKYRYKNKTLELHIYKYKCVQNCYNYKTIFNNSNNIDNDDNLIKVIIYNYTYIHINIYISN